MSTAEFEERVVTVPLRDANEKPVQQRADYAIKIVRQHLAKHFSVEPEEVRLDASVNEAVWANGRQNPPSKLRVRAARFVEDDEPVLEAEHAE
jgi:large subunit ribosomal protein L31e